MDYADQLLVESRNNINFKADYVKNMLCPNRWPLGPRHTYPDPIKYRNKKNRKFPQCPSGKDGKDGKVDMLVKEDGIWTTIECPVCGYIESWAIGDGDELF